MKKKTTFFTECAYIFGLIILSLGTAFMEKSDFGVSMVVAPSYLIYLKVSGFWTFYTFGMSEYVFQGALLCVLFLILRRFKAAFLLSFASAFLFGNLLDASMFAIGFLSADSVLLRGVYYVVGVVLCSLGVALVFHTYLPPEVYELFVRELSGKIKKPVEKLKLFYDLFSCALGVCLSFIFFGFGNFVGVKWGTLLCAAVNGPIIGFLSRFLEKRFEFKDKFAWRAFFTL